MTLSACTVASPAYRAHAAVMAETFLAHNPDSKVAVVDLARAGAGAEGRVEPPDGGRVEVIDPGELFDDPDELARMGLAYSIQGLAGAMKGRILRHLLARGDDPAVLIDADICVLGPLDELGETARREGAVLTTHMVRPHDEPTEEPTLLAGTINSGFIAVGASGAELLDWWNERTRRRCIFQPADGLVWEQSWLGLAPALFPVKILRDAGVNAMTRELLDRDVEWVEDEPYLSGSRLRAFHFSGPYDPRHPELLLSQAPSSAEVVVRESDFGVADRLAWLSLERKPGAARMSREYARRLLAAGSESCRDAKPPFWRLPGGPPLHPAMRCAYREALIESEREGGEPPPNPFLGDPVPAFIRWLAEVPEGPASESGLSRFALGMWSSDGVSPAFPDPHGADHEAFSIWLSGRLRTLAPSLPPRLREGGGAGPRRGRLSSRLRALASALPPRASGGGRAARRLPRPRLVRRR